MTKILVICGGTSSERDVSLRSGGAVAAALSAEGYDVTTHDSDVTDAQLRMSDVVFPVLHGAGGEDGTFQERLEALGIPFVGSGSTASKLCMDKAAYREFVAKNTIRMPAGSVVTHHTYIDHPLTKQPHVLKPIDGGSSIDTHIIRDVDDVETMPISLSFTRHHTMLLEELIIGTELTVGVLRDTALPVIEIIPPQNAEFDYTNKYNGATQELCPPQHVSAEVQVKVQSLAQDVHRLTNCRDMSRSDFIVTRTGKCYLLETNTIPGMTETSLFPKMARTAGLSMPELTKQLVEMALERRS